MTLHNRRKKYDQIHLITIDKNLFPKKIAYRELNEITHRSTNIYRIGTSLIKPLQL